MFISWFGQACFKIQGENTVLITDPFDNSYGLKAPRLTADIATSSCSDDDHSNIKAVKGTDGNPPFIVDGPGEYEFKNTFIYGATSHHDDKENQEKGRNIVYRIEIDNIKIGHLGNLKHALINGEIEILEGIDILMIPVGGTYTIDAKKATEIISQLEPRIVIPMHYNIPGLKLKNKIENVDTFCKEIGVCPTEKVNKFKISKKDLPQEDLQVIILEP